MLDASDTTRRELAAFVGGPFFLMIEGIGLGWLLVGGLVSALLIMCGMAWRDSPRPRKAQ